MIRGLEWLLGREPEQDATEEVPGSADLIGRPIYLIKTADLRYYDAGLPLRLLYYFDAETVVFWGISFDRSE